MRFSEVVERIKTLRTDLMEYYIKPMTNRIDFLEGQINCLKGRHADPVIRNDLIVCPRCHEARGKIAKLTK